MSESEPTDVSDSGKDLRSLALTPTWSVASVLTIFVAVSLLVERSIHRLGIAWQMRRETGRITLRRS